MEEAIEKLEAVIAEIKGWPDVPNWRPRSSTQEQIIKSANELYNSIFE